MILENFSFNLELSGKYANGCGQASKAFETDARKKLMKTLFGCNMFGTFNFMTNSKEFESFLEYPYTKSIELKDETKWWFYNSTLVAGKKSFPCWAIHWMGPNKNKFAPRIELISKQLIPNEFKEAKNLKLIIHRPWSSGEITNWYPTATKWFQTFDWSPEQKADNNKVWEIISNNTTFSGKTVLEIGPHTGYYSCKASHAGAFVTAYDKNSTVTKVAKTIAEHIECTDVNYVFQNPRGYYDTILYLSVHHQDDPKYAYLKTTINELKNRCKELFVELIVPPLEGSTISVDDVDRMLDTKHLLHYKHNIRCFRRLYKLNGTWLG